jgi:hypothetical protein
VSRPSTAFSLPQTIKAARAYVAARKSRWEAKFTCWEAQFALGDALNVECPVGPNGVNNDATDLLKNVEQVLLDNGIKIGFRRLEMFRSVAHAWSEPRRRHRGVSLDAHLAAGNPDRLDAIVREAKPDQPITSRYVREKVKQKDAKKKANTRERWRERQAASALAAHDANSAAVEARGKAGYFDKKIRKHIAELTSETIEELAQKADAVITSWSICAVRLRNHLSGELAEAAE